MRSIRLFLPIALAFVGHSAIADSPELPDQSRLGQLQVQIDDLTGRIESLENNAPNSDVDGRTYCMMVDVTILRGFSSNGTEIVETRTIRRFAWFSGGVFNATLVSGIENVQDDNGIVTSAPANSPQEITATYAQTGGQLNMTFPDNTTASWYVSGDGSVIHSNATLSLGPFPSSMTLGLARHATLIESTNCEAA